jgi:nitrate reductase assembly molybdenum cofactor insertion protein NarJ
MSTIHPPNEIANTPLGANLNPGPFVLASVLMSYPMDGVSETLPALLADERITLPAELRSLISERTKTENLQDLQSEYIAIFDNGRDSNPIYETEYDRRRALAKGKELSDIAGFYHAFGFELDHAVEGMEMLDHVGIELEFYALLLMKQIHLLEIEAQQGVEIVEDGRKKFLQSHLGRFIGAISRRPGVEASAFYGPVFKWGAALVAEECKKLNLTVEQAEWLDAPAADKTTGETTDPDDKMECGALSGCVK